MRTSFLEDLGIDPDSLSPEAVVAHLDQRILETVVAIEASEAWAVVTGHATPRAITEEVLKEIYLEICMYQNDQVEAAICVIAQMPRTMKPAWFDEMLHHQAEEFDHGEMAFRDYRACGGLEEVGRRRPMSPSAFAVSAVWRNFVHKREPFMYLGAIYLFEALTPIVTGKAMSILAGRGLAPSGLEFITHHATADIEHASSMRELIAEIAAAYPESKSRILYGFEHFAHIYPLPCWEAARRRAMGRFVSTADAA